MLSVFPVFRHHSRKDWRERRNCDVRKDLWDCYKGQGRNWPKADRRVPSNHPRHNCGTHFCSSSPLVSKVTKTAFFLSCLFIFWAEEGESGGVWFALPCLICPAYDQNLLIAHLKKTPNLKALLPHESKCRRSDLKRVFSQSVSKVVKFVEG